MSDGVLATTLDINQLEEYCKLRNPAHMPVRIRRSSWQMGRPCTRIGVFLFICLCSAFMDIYQQGPGVKYFFTTQ